jgi:hypothetical protein
MGDSSMYAAATGHPPGGCRNSDCHDPSPGRLTLGFCERCYRRWSHAGRPDEVPEPRKGGWPSGKPRGPDAALAAQWETYIWLRSPAGGSLSHAAARAGSGCEPVRVNEAALCAPSAESQ